MLAGREVAGWRVEGWWGDRRQEGPGEADLPAGDWACWVEGSCSPGRGLSWAGSGLVLPKKENFGSFADSLAASWVSEETGQWKRVIHEA